MPLDNNKTEISQPAEGTDNSKIPSDITTRKSLFPISKRLALFIIVLIILLIGILGYKIFATKLHPLPQTNLIEKQTKLLQVNQGLDEQNAKIKAQEEIKRREKIRLEAQKRGIAVTKEEIENEAQRLISQTSQADVTRTLQSYGWTEEDWKAKIAIDILADKLSKSISQWRDYQLLMIRWDNSTKPKLSSDEEAWEKAKEILEQARLRLEKKESIDAVFASLNQDKDVNIYFVVQAITKTQRIYSYTTIGSPQLKQHILSTPPHTLSPVLKTSSFAVIIQTYDGADGQGGSLDDLLNKQSWQFPSLVKTAYATHLDATSCAASGSQQYCAAGDYCYYEGVIRGFVSDPAGNIISGASVSANNPGPNPVSCLCTGIAGSATSDFFGGYDIHGLCCFANPFEVTATKSGYNCDTYFVTAANGINVNQNIVCSPIPPPPPPPTPTPTPIPTPAPTPVPVTPTVQCSTTVSGNNITWSALASSGTPPYTSYNWTSSDIELNGKTGNPVTVTYSTSGTKTGSVTVTDSLGKTGTSPQCSGFIPPPPGSCTITSATGAVSGSGQSISTSWSAVPGATSYQPDLKESGSSVGGINCTTGTSWTFPGPYSCTGNYTVFVTAFSGANCTGIITSCSSSVTNAICPGSTYPITATVYIDDGSGGGTAGNGVRDGTEAGYNSGATNILFISPGSPSSAPTNTSGQFIWNVLSGGYTVSLAVPGGYTATTPTSSTVTVPPNGFANFGIKPTVVAPTPTPIPGPFCGNKICDLGENSCNCSIDCGSGCGSYNIGVTIKVVYDKNPAPSPYPQCNYTDNGCFPSVYHLDCNFPPCLYNSRGELIDANGNVVKPYYTINHSQCAVHISAGSSE